MTNDWYIKKDNTDFTVKYYSEDMYQIYNELYETLNVSIHKRIKHLPKENQIQIIDLLTKRFTFEYPENENE